MERHDEEKLDLLFPQLAFDGASRPVQLPAGDGRVDTKPVDFHAGGAVPFDQQQAARSSVNARNPSFQDVRLLGVVPVGLALGEPFREARRQSFQNPAIGRRVFFSGNGNVHAAV
jgi:hypothetical protein